MSIFATSEIFDSPILKKRDSCFSLAPLQSGQTFLTTYCSANLLFFVVALELLNKKLTIPPKLNV